MEKGLRVELTGCDGRHSPLGISTKGCVLSWNIAGEGTDVLQRECRIQVAEEAGFREPVYDQGIVTGDTRWHLETELEEKTGYFWRVSACVEEGGRGRRWLDWSPPAWFETGLAGEGSWKGKWIEADEGFYHAAEETAQGLWGKADSQRGMLRCPYLKKVWKLPQAPERARVYVTAHGFYHLSINGERVGDLALAPDFTAYDKMVYYQTFDLTSLLHAGENQVEAILADGWYAGHAQGIPGRNHLYGERPALLLQAEAVMADGSREILVSDREFGAFTGPLLYADLFMGERLDMRQIPVEYGTVEKEYSRDILAPQKYGGIEEKRTMAAFGGRGEENGVHYPMEDVLAPAEVWEWRPGIWMVDFGQVLAGYERIRFQGEGGNEIKIEHSEALDPHTGDLAMITQRFPHHDQTDYVFVAEEDFVYEPTFSFQGFRYLKISGLKGRLEAWQCGCAVLETRMDDTCAFRCSHAGINRLVANAYWSQCGNMISIPTDCPQRERGGFTGDAQIFATTAAWNQDVYGFFRRWLEQCRLEQLRRGQIPIVVPYTEAYRNSEPNPGWTSAGWGDAIIFVPLDLYRSYGDRTVLRENYTAMEKWMDYVTACAEDSMPERYYMDYSKRRYMRYLWNTGYHWGDWLMPGCSDEEGVACSKEITASLFYYRQARCMEEISRILEEEGRLEEGRDAEGRMTGRSAYYGSLAEKIKEAFHGVYITEEGRLTRELQGLYVMAIAFGMVEGELRESFAARLDGLVREAGCHLGTGFLSTPFLLDVLWDTGYRDTAYKVLYQDSFPSWMYEVKQGATTIWEHWDEIREDGSFAGGSFNHYAFGCIADFIYRRIAGVKPLTPGFGEALVWPEAVEGISFAAISHRTMYGWLKVRWEKAEGRMRFHIEVPHGMRVRLGKDEDAKWLGSGIHDLT